MADKVCALERQLKQTELEAGTKVKASTRKAKASPNLLCLCLPHACAMNRLTSLC
jgi:hypothetical protein